VKKYVSPQSEEGISEKSQGGYLLKFSDKDEKALKSMRVKIFRYPYLLNVRILRFWRYFLSGVPPSDNFTPAEGEPGFTIFMVRGCKQIT
jgi:hypothetical protein